MSIKVKSPHPIVEAMAKKLFGIEMCPPAEQKRMVARAVRVVAEMVAELEADAKLGRMVRSMPIGSQLVIDSDEKGPYWYMKGGVPDRFKFEETPEEALERAGVREVER